MSFPDWGDVPTWGLFGGATITAIFAILAFWKQSKEVSDQAKLLEIQSGQLDAMKQISEKQAAQLAEMQKTSEKQATVLELQAEELGESLAERKRQAEEQRRGQASLVAAWFGHADQHLGSGPVVMVSWGAFVRNESPLPVYNVRAFFYYVSAQHAASEEWAAVLVGGPPSRVRALPPRSEQFIVMPENILDMSGQIEINDNTYVVSIEFTDAMGNRWERDERGALRSLDPDNPPPS